MTAPPPTDPRIRRRTTQRQFAPRPTPPPGRRAMTLAAVTIGVLLLGVQLWLLTVAVDLYLGDEADDAWTLALASGLVFVGGLFAYWILREPHPTVPRPQRQPSDAGTRGPAASRRPPRPR